MVDPRNEIDALLAVACGAVVAVLIALLPPASAQADHAYGFMHKDPDAVRVIDNTPRSWDRQVDRAVRLWSRGTGLKLVVTRDRPRSGRCPHPQGGGRIRICAKPLARGGNADWRLFYGYLRSARVVLGKQLRRPHSRRAIACHELGHALGLGHYRRGCLNARRLHKTRPSRHSRRALYMAHPR